MAEDSKKLIMGLISGLSLEQIKPFFLSLEKTGYRGEICMAVSDLGVATQTFLRSRRVQMVPFQKAFLKGFPGFAANLPGLLMSRRRRAAFDRHLAPAYLDARCARYCFYQSWVQELGGSFSQIMLTDVRDVLFQADPFAFEGREGLQVFLEDRSRTLGSSEPHTRALLQVFGRAACRALSSQPVVSTGVTIGTPAAIREHLAGITHILCEKKARGPLDRAIQNFLVHQQPPAKLHQFENSSGPVLTLGGVDPTRLQFNDRGQLITPAGSIVNTLHQYDRQPELAQRLLKLLT